MDTLLALHTCRSGVGNTPRSMSSRSPLSAWMSTRSTTRSFAPSSWSPCSVTCGCCVVQRMHATLCHTKHATFEMQCELAGPDKAEPHATWSTGVLPLQAGSVLRIATEPYLWSQLCRHCCVRHACCMHASLHAGCVAPEGCMTRLVTALRLPDHSAHLKGCLEPRWEFY